MTYEPTESEVKTIQTGAALRLAYPALTEVFTQRKFNTTNRLIGAYRSGEHDKLLGIVAELAAIADIQQSIERVIKELNILEEKQNA